MNWVSVEVAFPVSWKGYCARSEEVETLPLKRVQSLDERKPLVVPLACEMESVLPLKESGPETVADVIAPVPLPVRRPPSVVEPVPPKAVVRVVVPRTEPLLLVYRSEDGMLVMANDVEVPFAAIRFVVLAVVAVMAVVEA